MRWEHKVSLDWLKERQSHLTASEIKQLIPYTKTGRPRKVTDDDRIKVMAGKLKILTEEDCMSYGLAARGHLLEPYAIEEFNKFGGPTLFHWDDKLIEKEEGGWLAFSPDALSISKVDYETPVVLGEVKSYNAEAHLHAAFAIKDELEERWQIATAMAVMPNITTAYLILFNPSLDAGYRMFYHRYDRIDLADEIKTVLKIEREWEQFVPIWNDMIADIDLRALPTNLTENGIIAELEQTQRLNP